MGIQVTTRVTGANEVVADIGLGIKRIKDARPAFERMAANLRQAIGKEQFDTEGRARGTPWPQLSHSTLKRRERRTGYYKKHAPRGTPRILYWTGGLRRSYEARSNPKHIERIGRTNMEWGSALPPRPRREPDRPILTFRAGEEDKFLTRELFTHVTEPFE